LNMRSKVKVTVTFNANLVSNKNLENTGYYRSSVFKLSR